MYLYEVHLQVWEMKHPSVKVFQLRWGSFPQYWRMFSGCAFYMVWKGFQFHTGSIMGKTFRKHSENDYVEFKGILRVVDY